MSGTESPQETFPANRLPRVRLDRRAARLRWVTGIVVTILFHAGIIFLLQVDLRQRLRADRSNPRVVWMGDRTLLEESTMRGQVMKIFDDAPLFLPTRLNFASLRRPIEEAGPPGEIFKPYAPVMVVPADPGNMGLFSSPPDSSDPASLVRNFRWPYLNYFQRDESVARPVEPRLARIEVRSMETATLALSFSVSLEAAANEEAWPDWEPFELFATVSAAGRMAEPVAVGRGSRSEIVDDFVQDYIRNLLRLDLRLAPGYYQILIGP